MSRNKEIYDNYIANKKAVWKKRLTFQKVIKNTLYPCYASNVCKFFREKDISEIFKNIHNVTDYRKVVSKLATEYLAWSNEIEKFDEFNYNNVRNFFIGAFGELFYICFLTELKSIIIDQEYYVFTNIAPLTEKEDFGVDGTATYAVGNKQIDCALQIKFWNEFSDTQFGLKTAQGVFAQAVVDGYIEPSENKNVIICWLGSDNKVSKFLKEDKSFYKKVVFIDMLILNKTINDQIPFFWNEKLPAFIKDIVE